MTDVRWSADVKTVPLAITLVELVLVLLVTPDLSVKLNVLMELTAMDVQPLVAAKITELATPHLENVCVLLVSWERFVTVFVYKDITETGVVIYAIVIIKLRVIR